MHCTTFWKESAGLKRVFAANGSIRVEYFHHCATFKFTHPFADNNSLVLMKEPLTEHYQCYDLIDSCKNKRILFPASTTSNEIRISPWNNRTFRTPPNTLEHPLFLIILFRNYP
jgi:hypothetical protein